MAERIALVAHDKKKDDLIKFAQNHESILKKYELIATGTTGRKLNENTNLEVIRMASGPLGGDQQIGAQITDNLLKAVIFLRDPLTAQPHEPDVSALLRVCDVHNVPLATNLATADMILESLKNE
ncbi:methylglyoxal synthase [Orenia metallireducens]|uniref:Methylglyoxal synthase n=1 Tax=Orenia metallireducens TaxID=1413210 RepID=A0A285F2L9_9FIRM|nr:methylglyoxal synthase [Orenia metallireducens]PRX34765.1 methylglyoxal synthase [Orenia metallireducens]SNY05538.1 methylglyoxal synthase [Orenia metallireducens]